MPFVRKDVWNLGAGWNDTLLWYARGVRELQKRPITNRTSWLFMAAMHGFDEGLWQAFQYLAPTDPLPPQSDLDQYWGQCQHQTWYFLPWHRGYLAAFEAIVRAAIAGLDGAPTDWALPYWNYNNGTIADARKLPSAFEDAKLPDGTPNPLAVTRRYGDGTGQFELNAQDIRLTALKEPNFTGTSSGGSTGFGGVETLFSHEPDNSPNGQLESRPHNVVHSFIGGHIPNSNPLDGRNQGLMSMPDTAALDPIFWLHHSNIDRLWEVWLNRDQSYRNPSAANWLDGPADRKFILPDPNGNGYAFSAQAMLNTQAPNLNYTYEDVSDPLDGESRLTQRLIRLNLTSGTTADFAAEKPVEQSQVTELVGANDSPVQLGGAPVETSVRLDADIANKVTRSFQPKMMLNTAAKEPDRVFLNLENIRGSNDSAVFQVYVNLPEGADPASHPDHLAGAVSLFGVRRASLKDDKHAGNGISEVLEITDIVDALHLDPDAATSLNHLRVRFVPRTDIRPEDKITVGRVSVYRQGA